MEVAPGLHAKGLCRNNCCCAGCLQSLIWFPMGSPSPGSGDPCLHAKRVHPQGTSVPARRPSCDGTLMFGHEDSAMDSASHAT